MLETMQSLLSTEARAKFQEELLQEYLEDEKIVGQFFKDKTKYTIHDMWKTQRDFIINLTKRMNLALDGIIGQQEMNAKMEEDLDTHRDAIATEMSVDFENKYSKHDLIRNEMRYIKKLLSYPVEQIDKETKEKDQEQMNTPIEAQVDTPAEDTVFTE